VAREALGRKDARTLAREFVGLTQDEFSRAFSKSPTKRAKLRGLKRNAAVVLGNVGTSEDADVLTRALGDEEPLVQSTRRGRWPASSGVEARLSGHAHGGGRRSAGRRGSLPQRADEDAGRLAASRASNRGSSRSDAQVGSTRR
jgi:hypothetical protein